MADVKKRNAKDALSVPVATQGEMIIGAVTSSADSYSTHFEKNFNVDGSPSKVDLESIFNAPQDHIDNIVGYSKYCYRKYGIIMRVVNIMRDFGSDGIKLSYPKKDQRVKTIIEEYNKRINVGQLVKDMIFELALTGNLVAYDREGERVDIYPINQIEVLPLLKNNKQVVAYKVAEAFGNLNNSYGKEIDDLIQNAYPVEILDAKKKSSQYFNEQV